VASDAPPYRDAMEQFRTLGGGGRMPPIEPQLPSPEDPEMEARLKRLEDDFRSIRTDLNAMTTRIAAVEGKLDVLITQVVAKVPAAWQMLGVLMSALLGVFTLLGSAILALRWLKLLP
jgi:hypothetical protein